MSGQSTQSKDFKNTGSSTGSNAGSHGSSGSQSGAGSSHVANDLKDKANQAMDKAKDAGTTVMEKASDMASQVGQGARKMAENFGDRAESGVSSVGSGIRNLAGAVRERAPHEGFMGSAASSVADTLDQTGNYLEHHGFGSMGEDVTAMVRKNPVPCLFAAAAVGYLLARTMRS